MASSTAPETHQAAQAQLISGPSTPGDAGVGGASSASATVVPASPTDTTSTPDRCQAATSAGGSQDVFSSLSELSSALSGFSSVSSPPRLDTLPSEVLALVASFLDVDDLLRISRTCRRLRNISIDPVIHHYRLRNARFLLASYLSSPCRPSRNDLMSRSIFLTQNTIISRRLAQSLISIRLSRRLASRLSASDLVQRCVLPQECVPGMVPVHVAPGLVAKRKTVEKERIKDGLRRWISASWKNRVHERAEDARRSDEIRGVGRVWKLRRFWERMSRGEMPVHGGRAW
ncbi:hypothetical protein BBK36DRAFT_1120663 [Trichoderma citrinoviride]|uniref:F-box domain-containing protein n=1 Tax=Trichoderma citrinoviride TaxID=58853 RepID=A0A2T4B879_9HYPO|nr:hypothetical protein BBK36DRAFT_1120663 [Trichoderma citrinoviride]PTB65537.1 hypothetical protein BBK36DRAFT_1120663 [Trichoderma citrinoviride]